MRAPFLKNAQRASNSICGGDGTDRLGPTWFQSGIIPYKNAFWGLTVSQYAEILRRCEMKGPFRFLIRDLRGMVMGGNQETIIS